MVGHIKIDRKILNWEWYTDIKMFHLFLYLLLKANWKDGKWQGNLIKRGQVIIGRLKVSKDTGLSEMQIRTCLNKLKSTNEITIKSTNKFTIVTICKYDFYQNQSDDSNQQNNQQVNQPITNNQPTSNQQVTTIEEELIIKKKDKNDNIFNIMPKVENFNGLPEKHIQPAKEFVKIISQKDLTETEIRGMWEIFKVQNLTGKKYYADEEAVYSHFLNWIKTQKFTNGTINKSNFTGNSKQAGANQLLEQIKRNSK